jgi:hypothetical protein
MTDAREVELTGEVTIPDGASAEEAQAMVEAKEDELALDEGERMLDEMLGF